MMLTVGRGQESQVMLTAATHGDELITVEVLLALTERLVAGDGISPRLTSILNSRLIHIVPVVNPDGFSSQDRYEGDTDPNRSYPAPGREKNRPTPSIAALIRFFQATPIKASVDFHASGSLVMYPWAYTDDAIEDTAAGKAAEFSQLAANMAAQNSYRSGQISRILYPAVGSSCDFYFWKKQSRSLAIELGSEKVPHPSEIPEYIESQVESTWVFLESI
jgi:predicted deacylase